MSRKIEKRKQLVKDCFALVVGVFLTVFCLAVMVRYIVDSATVVDSGTKTKADSKDENVLMAQQIIIDVENGDPKSAIEKIDSLGNTFPDSSVLEYFKNFKNYYLKHSKLNTKIECLDTSYFVLRSLDLKSFFEARHTSNLIYYLEAIPYYCIKNFMQGQNANNKNSSNLELYETFIRTFVESGATTITSKEADIICLYISVKKKSCGNSETELKQIQAEIEKIQNDYSAQLGENGTCVRQRDSLVRMHKWCEDKINKKWSWASFPEYRIPIEKK